MKLKLQNLFIAIACAIHYEEPTDEFATQLKTLREEKGIPYIIENVCKLDPDGDLSKLILEKVDLIKSWGWVK